MKSARLPHLSAIAFALAGFGSSAVACNVGDIQCDAAGYRYVCECWTATGCSYTQYGTCSSYRENPRGADARPIAYSPRADGPRNEVARRLRLFEGVYDRER